VRPLALTFLALIFLARSTAPAAAVPPSAECETEVTPPDLPGWTQRAPLKAARDAAGIAAAMLEPGKAAALVLVPGGTMVFVRAPGQPSKPQSFAGLAGLTIAQAGRYRVVLGDGAWIDLLRDGAPRPAVAHAHGAPCTGVHKTVDFDLTPGAYVVQLSNSTVPVLNIMAVRLP
jgi:hypothetical protein